MSLPDPEPDDVSELDGSAGPAAPSVPFPWGYLENEK